MATSNATRKIISSNQPRKNVGGTIFYGNPTGIDRTFIGVGLTYAGFFNSKYGKSFRIASNTFFCKNAALWPGGITTFNEMIQGDYVIFGVRNNKGTFRALGSGPTSDRDSNLFWHREATVIYGKALNYNFDIRTRRIVTAGWNEFTGQPLSTPVLSHDEFVLSGSTPTIPNRQIPGKFVFAPGKGGGKDAPLAVTRKNYSEKTG